MSSRNTETTSSAVTEQFAKKLNEAFSGTFLTLAVSIGAKTGLWDVLAVSDQPMTAQEIAEKAKLKPRYVKEWLGVCAAGRLVEIDSSGETYYLPSDYRPVLTGQSSVAKASVLMALLTQTVHHVGDCFPLDGPPGVSASTYTDILSHILQQRARYAQMVCIHYIDLVSEFKQLLENGCSLCDIGCGYGDFIIALAKKYPKSTFCGIDISQKCVNQAIINAKEQKVENIKFLCCDVLFMPINLTESFDIVTLVDTLHDLPYPDAALVKINQMIKHNRYVAVIEFNVHTNQADNVHNSGALELYSLSLLLCMPGSLWHSNGAGLGTCMGIEKVKQMLTENGFLKISQVKNPRDPANVLHIGQRS